MSDNTILIVDDEEMTRELLRVIFEDKGYSVDEASNADETFTYLEKYKPHLIILDIQMPGKNGIDVCKELKTNPDTKTIPIILNTCRSEKEDIIEGLNAGADDYLIKPFNSNEILARVQSHIRSKAHYKQLQHNDLVLLLELSEIVSTIRNPKKILRTIVHKMTDVIDVARCSIASIEEDGGLRVKVSSDLDSDEEIHLDLWKYPEIKKSLETKKPVLINNIKEDPLLEPVREMVATINLNSIVVVPIIRKESIIGTFFLRTASPIINAIDERVLNLCQLVANISANALENAILFESVQKANSYLEELAITDGLTNLYNHRHFYNRLDKEFSRAVRYNDELSCILLDIDDFKKINDTYGHRSGDCVLEKIGLLIKNLARECDIPSRYGGEEFAILLPQTGIKGALKMANRLLLLVREEKFKCLDENNVTISVGVSTLEKSGMTKAEQLIQHADMALYEVKHSGKNRVLEAKNDSTIDV